METADSPRPEPGLKEGAAGYLAARLELVRIEASEAGRIAARRGILAGLLAAFATFAWALILAGLVGLVAVLLQDAGHQIPWHLVAIGLGLVHLLFAALFGILLSRPGPRPFALSRVELEKDRAWLADIRNQLGSKH